MAGERGMRGHRHGDHDALNVLGELTPAEAFELVRIARRESGVAFNVQPDFYQSRVTGEGAEQPARPGAVLDPTGRAQPRARDLTPRSLRDDVNLNAIRLRHLSVLAGLAGTGEGGGQGTFSRLFFAAGTTDFVISRHIAFRQAVQTAKAGGLGAVRARAQAFNKTIIGATVATALAALPSAFPAQGASGELRSQQGAVLVDLLLSRVTQLDERLAQQVDRFNNWRADFPARAFNFINEALGEPPLARNTSGFPALRRRFDPQREPFITGSYAPREDLPGLRVEDYAPPLYNPFGPGRPEAQESPVDPHITTPQPVRPLYFNRITGEFQHERPGIFPYTPGKDFKELYERAEKATKSVIPDTFPTPPVLPVPELPEMFNEEDLPPQFFLGTNRQVDPDESTLVVYRMNPAGQRAIDAIQGELDDREPRRGAIRIV